MNKLEEYCTSEVINWLLGDDNPSVRYLTLRNLLDKREDDLEARGARQLLMEEGCIPKIMSHQNPDGSFMTGAMVREYGELRARSGYQPKYKNTIWQAIFLAQLGADGKDERVRRLCNFILNTNYSEQHGVFGIYVRRKRSLDFGAIPCFVGNMIWALSKLGAYGDQRIQRSLTWLVRHQRFDDGGFKTPKEWPYRGSRDRCFGKHSCYIGCTQSLKAAAVVPWKERGNGLRDFIQRGIDFVLMHKIYKKDHGNGRPIRREYELLTFPLTYYDDLIGILETLLALGVKNGALNDSMQVILKKRDRYGRWHVEKAVSGSSMHAPMEKKGRESKWITYRALNVLKQYVSQAGGERGISYV